ncbi:TIR domain-containing protein [Curtobacterium sp. MCLR17_054]|uniref:TIR domain-containing protein n=1 Tax=Curtobacterium sp. MCLR17_054 TaxID=2175632 RepID=UPI000DA83856|nr:TIR domain-containing protein [Curtobacterium sp. MCLR17_054]WIE67088.1 TIR domain-containing protein [Curtobacterium sp. MCLR17_054]
MRVFVSWSKSASKTVAEVFADWLPRVIQECEPFISSDTEKGDVWFDAIERNLAEARVGVLFLTPQNQNSAWLNYEAGALRTLRHGNMKKLCAVFVGMKTADYDGPIKNFQMTNFTDQADMLKLLKAINSAADRPLDDRRLEDEFNEKWERLATDTAKAVAAAESGGEPAATTPKKTRSADAKLDEVLDMLREMRFGQSVVSSGHQERAARNVDRPSPISELETEWVGQYFLDEGGVRGEIVDVSHEGGRIWLTTNTGFRVVGTRLSLKDSISPAPF